jgi:hypothetical protein
MIDYTDFLAAKSVVASDEGHDDAHLTLIPELKPHQADICRWAIAGGRRAIFANFGLGKTLMQLQITEVLICAYGGSSLIVCPLGVRQEFTQDARRFFDMEIVYIRSDEEHAAAVAAGHKFFITNYERVRDGAIDPNRFTVASLDEASVLRSFGSKTYQSFLDLFAHVRFRFVCTATPSPNRYKELIHYAGFLGVMDTGQALTRFFHRDSEHAGNLTLYPHKEREFWLWVSSWAVFLTRPSDLGYSDEGYDLPALRLHPHRLPTDHGEAGFDNRGQGKLLRDAAISLGDASREKRDTLGARIERAKTIVAGAPPDQHWLIWHDLEDERRAIEAAFPEAVTVYGTQDLDEREKSIVGFSNGDFRILATKPILAGSGCNFQRHCHAAIYLGVGYKFNDFIQSVHRIQRFLQRQPVDIHLIYSESEDPIYATLMEKWRQHDELRERMSAIIREYGLKNQLRSDALRRNIVSSRSEARGQRFTAVNADSCLEMRNVESDSIDLVVTSWPFSDQYEYTPTYNDFGHNDGDEPFFAQMDYLTPEVIRALKPGRMYCVHAKDRIVFGSLSGDGMYSVNPFSDKCVAHLQKHGLRFVGRITIVTDVVRENNQTYRLGWTEQCKDGTKMGVGMSEYVLLFRKLPTDLTRSYADEPVRHDKKVYTRARWQFDAHGFWRSSGDRFLTPEEVRGMDIATLRKIWHEYNGTHVYDFKQHVAIAEGLEAQGYLPSSFMLLDPVSHNDMVWDDVMRMRTLNGEQSRRQQMQHTCPLQFDIVDRLIERYSNPDDLVLDPFGGIGTVAVRALMAGRRGYTIELSPEYHADAVGYLRAQEADVPMPSLFASIDGAA